MTKNESDNNRTLTDQQLEDLTHNDKLGAIHKCLSVEDRNEAAQFAWGLMYVFAELVDLYHFNPLKIIAHALEDWDDIADLSEIQLDENKF